MGMKVAHRREFKGHGDSRAPYYPLLKPGILWHAYDDPRMMAASLPLHLELISREEDGAV